VFDFVGKRYFYFLLSLLMIVPGIISLAIPPGLKVGIDFASGSSLTLQFKDPVDQTKLRSELDRLGQSEAIIQKIDASTYFVRTRELTQDTRDAAGNITQKGEAT